MPVQVFCSVPISYSFWRKKKMLLSSHFFSYSLLSLEALKTFIFEVGALCFSHSCICVNYPVCHFYELSHYKDLPFVSPGKIAYFIHYFPFSYLYSVFLELDRYHLNLFFMLLKFSLLHYMFLNFCLCWISVIYILGLRESIGFL